MHRSLPALAFILIAVWMPAMAQKQEPAPLREAPAATAENRAEVPALREFHGVIFQIWHTAWPKKDASMLRALLPEVRTGAAKVAAAALPGILREKQQAWEKGVAALNECVAQYARAAEATDDQQMLDAAEALHTQYERLVRTIRPPLKEVDEFHMVLYMLYHYYMPGDSLAQIRSSAAQLQERMAALNTAVLPERLKARQPAFESARIRLSTAVDALVRTAASNEMASIRKAVTTLHASYQALERVFE